MLALQVKERRSIEVAREPSMWTDAQREQVRRMIDHELIWLLDSITNRVIELQDSEKPILDVLDVLAEHRDIVSPTWEEA